MATNFPASLDTLTNPTSSDSLSSPSHSAQHANVNDAVEALQAKVGANSSAVTTSLDYKVAQLEAGATADAVKSYADSSARTTAVPSPAEGDLSYLADVDSVEVYDGSAWIAVASSALTLITSTTFSSVTSVNLDGCFTSDYRNYMYQLEMPTTASSQHDIRMQYRSSGTTETSGVYQNIHIYGTFTGVASNFLSGFSFHYMAVSSTSTCSDAFGYFYRPAISGSTTGMSQFGSGSSFVFAVGNNSTTSTTAYDGVHLYHATGGTFSGTLRIFGMAS